MKHLSPTYNVMDYIEALESAVALLYWTLEFDGSDPLAWKHDEQFCTEGDPCPGCRLESIDLKGLLKRVGEQ